MMKPKRNDPCHCGSGKKYKHCHLKEDRANERAKIQAEADAESEIKLGFDDVSDPIGGDASPLPADLFKDPFAPPNYGPPPTPEEIEEVLDRSIAAWREIEKKALGVTESPEADSLASDSGTSAMTIVTDDSDDEVANSKASEAETADGEDDEQEPKMAILEQLYELFERAEHEDKITILRACIEAKALDDEQAFHFFNELYYEMVEHDERVEFGQLTNLFRTTMPELYADQNHWFWGWEIADALTLQDDEALQAAVDQLIEMGGQDVDQFYPAFNCLLYHDRRKELIHALEAGKTHIPSGKYMPGTKYQVYNEYSDLLVNNYLETHSTDQLMEETNFKALCDAIEPYTEELLVEGLEEYIQWAGGLHKGEWTLADFQFKPQKPRRGWFEEEDEAKKPQDPAIVQLRHLSFEFLHYARQIEDIPYCKADMARTHLTDYIIERYRGELVDDDNSNRGRSSKRSKQRSKAKAISNNILLPDHKTLDRYLSRFFSFFANRVYEGAATFELIPTWVRFLQSKELVTEDEGQQALKSMQALHGSMTQMMEKHQSDPALRENMREMGRKLFHGEAVSAE